MAAVIQRRHDGNIEKQPGREISKKDDRTSFGETGYQEGESGFEMISWVWAQRGGEHRRVSRCGPGAGGREVSEEVMSWGHQEKMFVRCGLWSLANRWEIESLETSKIT